MRIPPNIHRIHETLTPERREAGGLLDRRHLRVSDLQRLRHLQFVTKRRMRGRLAGRHSSRQRGHSVEFNDFRQYLPGDEIGDVDWKVYARSDKLFIKLYDHETELTAHLLVDASASMAFRGVDEPDAKSGYRKLRDIPSKYDLACSLAAAIAFLVIKQADRASLGVASNGLASFDRPIASMNQLPRFLDRLEAVEPRGEARLSTAIADLMRVTGRRGLLILFSDLLEDQDATAKALGQAALRGDEVILFHVLHADELSLPDSAGTFIDSETGEKMRVHVADIRAAYDVRMTEFLDRWRRTCAGLGIDYNLVSTEHEPHRALERYLLRRSMRRG